MLCGKEEAGGGGRVSSDETWLSLKMKMLMWKWRLCSGWWPGFERERVLEKGGQALELAEDGIVVVYGAPLSVETKALVGLMRVMLSLCSHSTIVLRRLDFKLKVAC